MGSAPDLKPGRAAAVPKNKAAAIAAAALGCVNNQARRAAMLALLATACVLTYSAGSRFFFKTSNDWQDEVSVFMLAGSAFMSSAWVQSIRGHVAVELLSEFLSPKANAARLALADLASGAFVAFFSWKSWALFHEAWTEGQATSSSFGAPLWIPYSMMALGTSLLAIQLLLQFAIAATGGEISPGDAQ